MLHGIWNGSAFYGTRNFLTAYAVVMLPLLIVIVSITIWARSREGRMLLAALQQTVQMGWTRPEEVRWVARLSDRVSARRYARLHGGPQAAKAMRAFQQTMIEIAFLHNRFVDGIGAARRERPDGRAARPRRRAPAVRHPPAGARPAGYGGPPPGAAAVPATVPAWVPPGLPEWYGPGRRHPADRCRLALTRVSRVLRRAGRRTNLGLLLLLVGSFATGWVAFATAGPVSARVAAVAHGVLGLGLVVLTPWKVVVARRAPRLTPASLGLAAVVVVVPGGRASWRCSAGPGVGAAA